MRVLRRAVALVLLALGVMLFLYGLLALLYRGDGAAASYVSLAGREVNARLMGAASLVLAALLLGGFGALVRSRRVS